MTQIEYQWHNSKTGETWPMGPLYVPATLGKSIPQLGEEIEAKIDALFANSNATLAKSLMFGTGMSKPADGRHNAPTFFILDEAEPLTFESYMLGAHFAGWLGDLHEINAEVAW